MTEQHDEAGASEFELFMLELQAIPDNEFTRARLMELLASFAGARFYLRKRTLLLPKEIRMAVHLLKSGMSRAEAARQLANHLDVSEATGYRRIAKALNVRLQNPNQGTLL